MDKELFTFIYGSQVYGTATQDSDIDMFVVCADDSIDFNGDIEKEIEYVDGNIDKHCITISKFIKLLQDCDIKALEAVYLSREYITNYELFRSYIDKYFVLDLEKVRVSISSVCSNSWVKCKKKLIVEKDYDPYIAKKSLWHVIRLYSFGIQIGKYGKIVDYSEYNKYYNEIMDMPNDWNELKKKYQPLRNKLHSEFVICCPLNK